MSDESSDSSAPRISTTLLQTIFERAGEGIFVADSTGRFLEVNRHGCNMLGYSREEILRRSIQDLIPAEDLTATPLRLADLQAGHIVLQERRLRCKDGRLLPVEISGQALADGRLVGFVRDITSRKQMEAALRASQARLTGVIDSAMDAIISVDEAQRILLFNAAAEKIFGWPAGEVLGQSLDLLIPERFWAAHRDHIHGFGQTGVTARAMDDLGIVVGQRANGQEFPAEASISQTEAAGAKLYTVILRDITRRKEAEAAFRESEEKLRLFIEHAPVALAMFDREMRYLAVSRRWLTDYHLEVQDITGHSHYDIFPEIPERWREVHRRGLEGEILRTYEDSFERADGLVQWLRWEVRPWYTTAGDVGGIIIFTEDITARKRTEAALYQSEERFAKTFRANPLAMSLCRQSDGHFIAINDSFNRLFGHQREAVIGHTSFELNMYRHPDDRAELMRQLQEQGALYNYELTMLTKSGEPRQTLLSIELIDLNDETHLLSIMVDITERKEAEATQAKLEEQLRQAQKMESIGRLAGGVAHDFNNLLTVIQGYAEFLQIRLAPDDPLQRSATQIQQAAQSAAGLTRQLLAFSRKQILAPVILDLNELVTDLHKMLKRLIGEDIRLETKLASELHPVLADPGQMEQVLLNLVVNARDAMPTGGRLTLETANVELDQIYLSTHLEAPLGPAVMLAVTDTGQGMDKQTQTQIFEPFFTTKALGLGTGLGLATVYGIVKQSGGDIHVYSEPGQGTTFKIYLPAAETATGPLSPKQARPQVRGGSETILLVEDEALVRDMILETLQEGGYTVLEAHWGEEALLLARTHPGPIDMLVTDVVMPEMSGRVLAEQLTILRPDLKVLYISGYTDDAVVRHGLLAAEVEFLSKPFSPTTLAAKVRAVLDKN